MKRNLFILAGIFLVVTVMLASCVSSDAKKAAKTFLKNCQDVNENAYFTAMPQSVEDASLTEIEKFVLKRMKYEFVQAKQQDDTHVVFIVDIQTIDLMELLNNAFLLTYTSADEDNFNPNTWVLAQLNTGSAENGMFRAELPMRQKADGTWILDTEADLESLRDALSGGAYTWWQLYDTYILSEVKT